MSCEDFIYDPQVNWPSSVISFAILQFLTDALEGLSSITIWKILIAFLSFQIPGRRGGEPQEMKCGQAGCEEVFFRSALLKRHLLDVHNVTEQQLVWSLTQFFPLTFHIQGLLWNGVLFTDTQSRFSAAVLDWVMKLLSQTHQIWCISVFPERTRIGWRPLKGTVLAQKASQQGQVSGKNKS